MCREIVNGARIPVEEKQRSFVFLNPERESHELIKVDGCEITQGLRCDWAIFLCSGREVYIELKGTDLNHAYEQVSATIPVITNCQPNDPKVFCLIAKRVPAEDTTGQRMRLRLLKRFSVKTIKRSRTFSANESQLFD